MSGGASGNGGGGGCRWAEKGAEGDGVSVERAQGNEALGDENWCVSFRLCRLSTSTKRSQPAHEPASQLTSQPSEPARQPTSQPASWPACRPARQPASQRSSQPTTQRLPQTQSYAYMHFPFTKYRQIFQFCILFIYYKIERHSHCEIHGDLGCVR